MNEKLFVNKLIDRLEIELNKQDKCGVYSYTQKYFAYNSNKIEGSQLTKKQINSLFDKKH